MPPLYHAGVLALRTLTRRKTRTTLTVIGVAIGIASVVALIAVARGFRQQFNEFFLTGQAHLVVTRAGAADPFLSYLPDGLIDELQAFDDVARAFPFLFAARQVPGQPFFFIYGTTEGSPFLAQTRTIEGRDLFSQMWSRIAARVTDLIFKIQAVSDDEGGDLAGRPVRAGPGRTPMLLQHADSTGAGFAGAVADHRAAMRSQNVDAKAETIRRDKPKVGRNDPCPCGSGKKYKQCHGKG